MYITAIPQHVKKIKITQLFFKINVLVISRNLKLQFKTTFSQTTIVKFVTLLPSQGGFPSFRYIHPFMMIKIPSCINKLRNLNREHGSNFLNISVNNSTFVTS